MVLGYQIPVSIVEGTNVDSLPPFGAWHFTVCGYVRYLEQRSIFRVPTAYTIA